MRSCKTLRSFSETAVRRAKGRGEVGRCGARGARNYLSRVGMQVSVSYDSAQNASVLDILFTTGSTSAREMATLSGVCLDVDAFAFGTEVVTAPGGLSFTCVPEPTAATLTLLALAGLVSRCRR